ncbi:MAG: hypothetical protein ACQGVC_21380 [Myxococcota bacterium]
MALRMLCTDCLHVGTPDTLLEGSDRVELLAWACLAVPGLVYCWWRHLRRQKICPQCGSGALMRESRASAARNAPQAVASTGARVLSPAAPFAWPTSLGSPRGRLRQGALAALASAFAGAAWLLGLLDVTPEAQALQAASGGFLLCAAWVGWQLQQILRTRGRWLGVEAWDESGRRLHIERL